MPSSITIRSYRRADRNAVRALAYGTAELGRRSSFADPVLQMDLLTRYYTDHEPASLWIADRGGNVVGYLTGCLKTKSFLSWLRVRGNALTAAHVVFRNFYRPAIWRWALARIKTLRAGGAHRPAWTIPYPAHFHMNLTADARGHGVGGALLEKFIAQCASAGVPGIHLSTRADNKGARRFFERHGFQPFTTINAYRPAAGGLEPVPVLIMARASADRITDKIH